jgi:ribonucleoside-diphosphate reductase alpha chain
MISAKEVWNTIIHSAWFRAEPGLLMWDNVTENTPADCYDEYKSRGTNPCSEINLSLLIHVA